MQKSIIPLIFFIALVALLAAGLRLDPREVPSPFIDKPAPGFNLPRLYEEKVMVTPDEMKGRVWLLNVWASWCGACRAEHKVITKLARESGLTIVGLNYKDSLGKAKEWLRRYGNPYAKVAVDRDGRAGIDWGVYGVPETFLIDQQGVIRYKNIGALTTEEVKETVLPLVLKLTGEVSS